MRGSVLSALRSSRGSCVLSREHRSFRVYDPTENALTIEDAEPNGRDDVAMASGDARWLPVVRRVARRSRNRLDPGIARRDANQLHAAIVNGDVESLRYWLQVRHADASSANTTEPDITPLERCLGLVARVLDGPSRGERGSRETAADGVSLRVLQEMTRWR